MPSMYEIYDSYSFEYDELVNHEDFQNNLSKKLFEIADFTGKTVIEPGIGTGKVTKLYIEKAKFVFGLDRANHMLERAKMNLSDFSDKISFHNIDNLNIAGINLKADIVIEGWGFGHTINDNELAIKETVKKLLEQCRQVLNPGGKIIIIETMGSGTNKPGAPMASLAQFYTILEKDYGFQNEIVRTDYRFDSVEQAARICGFFFGEQFSDYVKSNELKIVPEFTGIWHKVM
jgi:ubiquinone/menaquinone biosynthesis C-methylase UbiE